MSGDVHLLIPSGNDRSSQLHQVINGPAHTGFIARNWRCRNDDRITGHNADAAVIIGGHAGQTGHRFALAACRQDQHLVRRIAVQFIRFDKHAVRYFQVAQFDGNLHVIDHAAPKDGNFTLKQNGCIDSLLDTGNIGRKCRQDNPAFCFTKGLAERHADRRFRFGIPGPFGIGAVRHEKKYTAPAQVGKFVDIHRQSVYRCQIHLKIPGMDDGAYRRPEVESARIGNGMIRMNEPHLHTADLHFISMMHFI